jgi:hypothetical protein
VIGELKNSISWYADVIRLDAQQRRSLHNYARYYDLQIRQLGRIARLHRRRALAEHVSQILGNNNHTIVNAVRELSLSRRRQSGMTFQKRHGDAVHTPPTLCELKFELSNELYTSVGTPIDQWSEPKPGGGHRVFNNYCTLDRARQHMVRDIVRTLHPASPLEYSDAGRGRNALIQDIIEHVENGVTFWAALDIRNAYPSLNVRHVETLVPIVAELVAVTCVHIWEPPTNYPTDQQLPQGGLASQSILGAIVGREAQALTSLPRAILTYSDNVWIGAPTRAEVHDASEELIGRFRALAAGPLELVPVSNCSLRDGERFDAVGYTFRMFTDDPEERLHIAISNRSFRNFKERVTAHLDQLDLGRVPEEFHLKKTHWLNGFRLRSDSDQSELYYHTDLDIFLRDYLDQRAS